MESSLLFKYGEEVTSDHQDFIKNTGTLNKFVIPSEARNLLFLL